MKLLSLSEVVSGVSGEELNLILFAKLDELSVVCDCQLGHLSGSRVNPRVLAGNSRSLTVSSHASLL